LRIKNATPGLGHISLVYILIGKYPERSSRKEPSLLPKTTVSDVTAKAKRALFPSTGKK
jgi:hypothetical protein